MKLDVLAFAAHPDDLEITCGGTLIRLAEQGHAVGACDLTRGEMGTYGTPATRERECAESTRRMGLAARINCGLPDAALANVREQQAAVVEVLRRHRPEVILVPAKDQRHPDHAAAPRIVFDACYLAGLARFGSGATHRPRKILWVHTGYSEERPSFVVDITAQMEKKLSAVGAYESQFPAEGAGLARRDEMFEHIRARGRSYGLMIGKTYGEGFIQREAVEVEDPFRLPGHSI
jgi:bacillithiol biosynthesis deacetylase BshB1